MIGSMIIPGYVQLCHADLPATPSLKTAVEGFPWLPLMGVANAAIIRFKSLILLSVDPFTRERRQVQLLSANQKATEN